MGPNLEDQVSVFTSPRDRVAQLYPQALGSLFVVFYNSQGYGGGIRSRLHPGFDLKYGADIFLRNMGLSPNCMSLQTRIQISYK
jgi:hypothetical protein